MTRTAAARRAANNGPPLVVDHPRIEAAVREILLASGRLSGWAPWVFVRVLLVLGGVFALEFSSFLLHSVFADESVLPRYRILFEEPGSTVTQCPHTGPSAEIAKANHGAL